MTLPAYLQQYQVPDIAGALSANLGSAMPPHLSIGGGRFTLIDAGNNEIPVPTFDPKIGVYVDACIIDVNENMSRQYFSKPYDPSAPGERPDCYSDNGAAPSVGSPVPQSPTCAACPQAVWGSKISAQGNKIPACTQKQKIALLIPGFQTLFLLAVPPNSHSYLREYTEKCKGQGINMANLITRISFVQGVQGTLQFQPLTYIDEPTAVLRHAAYAEKKTDALVGRNDVARPVPADGHQPAVTHTSPAAAQITQQPASQVQQPAPFEPASAPAASATAQPSAPTDFVPSAALSEPAPATRRRRRTAAEMAAVTPGVPNGQAPQQPAAATQAPFPHPGQANQAPVQPGQPGNTAAGSFGIAQPAAASPELSTMLDDFFKN